MNTWLDIYNRVKAVDVEQEAVESFNDTSKDYTRVNAEQMYLGKLSTGQEITPGYAASTIAYKKRKGQPYNRVTLRDTGEFHKKMFAVADNDKIFLGSDTYYANYLAERYTDKIFGLDPENRKEYSFGSFYMALKRKVESITGLQFK
jgi:diphthamide synthase subunit DPH2